MTGKWCRRLLISTAALGMTIATSAQSSGQAQPTPLDQHPSIQYASRPTTDRVAKLNEALSKAARSLERDERTGYLLPVLAALGVPVESQLLVFSKTGIQRTLTNPHNPRALFFNESVVVGYNPGAPVLEVAAHDPQQGVVFYTLDQTAVAAPTFTRRTHCLSCHVSESTLEVPGMIARSNGVDGDGHVMPHLGTTTVNHQTPHTQRWGGWFVTANTSEAPRYSPLGHLGNVTVTTHPTSGPAIISNHVFTEWMDSAPETRGYPSSASDLGSLLVFDHQMHAINLLTRLNWGARIAADTDAGRLRDRVNELADYLLFVDEATPVVTVTPRPQFAAHLAASIPKDKQGRSFGQLDLSRRLLQYPCSYMIYADAFDALPRSVKEAVYRRMFAILSGKATGAKYAHLSAGDRRAILEILRDTTSDLPADIRAAEKS